jgi:hypothetical protein
MPPKAMFAGKHRPAGLEFASCIPCNNGARQSDLVAAYIGRCFPDATTEAELADLHRYTGALKQHLPAVLYEMRPPRAREKHLMRRLGMTEGGALSLGGPHVTAHLQAFAARLGLALHFEKTGVIVPPEGGIAARVFTNVDFLTETVPQVVIDSLSARALQAGRWTTEDQFLYDVVVAEDTKAMTMSFATFRFSFAVLSFSHMDRSQSAIDGAVWVKPGDFSAKPLPTALLAFSAYNIRSHNQFGWNRVQST